MNDLNNENTIMSEEEDSVSVWDVTFGRNKLYYGRNIEKEQLMECYNRVCTLLKSMKEESNNGVKGDAIIVSTAPLNETNNIVKDMTHNTNISEFVLVNGETGIGKKSFIHSTMKEAIVNDCGYYIHGIFYETAGQLEQPHSVFCNAINEFCQNIIARGQPTEITFFQKQINQYIKIKQQHILTDTIPSLRQILLFNTMGNTNNNINTNDDYDDNSGMNNQFKHMFRMLMRAITLTDKPIVFFLDDVHNADESSIDLLFTLLIDASSKNGILYIGSYKTTKDVPKRFTRFLERIKNCDPIRFTTIALQHFTSIEINHMLCEMMHLVDVQEDIKPLSELIHYHTHGKMFFIFECIRLLNSKHLLYFDVSESEWKWNMNEINIVFNTDISYYHDIYINSMIMDLSESTKHFLVCAACLGTKLDEMILSYVTTTSETTTIDIHLQSLAMKYLITFDNTFNCWIFTHDAIKEACYNIITTIENRDEFHYQLGRKLWLKLSIEEIDQYIFVIVDQLLYGIDIIMKKKNQQQECTAIAKLCLHAGKCSFRLSHFQNAFEYLSNGVQLLDNNIECWKKDYDFCLQLYNIATEVAYSVGNYDNANQFISVILKNARIFTDTIPANCSKLNVLGSKGRLHDAVHIGLNILRKLGEPIQRKYNSIRLYLEARKIHKKTQGMTDEDLLNLPIMKDELKLAAMKIINTIFLYVFLIYPQFVFYLGLRLMNLSLEYGKNTTTPNGFILYGTYLAR